MFKVIHFHVVFSFIFITSFYYVGRAQAAPARDSTYYNLNDVSFSVEGQNLFKTDICRAFSKIASNEGGVNGISMDQIEVYQGGKKYFSYYKPGVYNADSLHVMMSASKAVTATLLDVAIKKGLKLNGTPLSYDRFLHEFFRYDVEVKFSREAKGIKSFELSDQDQVWYEAIQLRHLVKMQSGFKWDESYNNPLGDFMDSLYGDGIDDIVQSSLGVPMERAPGTKFNYSGGNANLIQALLRKVGVENFGTDDPNEAAQKILFDEIGIAQGFFERDRKGSAVGSTYLYLTPKEMAILGHLYLNKGQWLSKSGRVEAFLTDEFLSGMTRVNSAVNGNSIDDEYLSYLESQGAPSNTIMWLNKDLIDDKGEVRYAKEFPSTSEDMFFLAGHNGQVIIMLPEIDVVMVMTGQNRSYWDKIDRIASYASHCFIQNLVKKEHIKLPPLFEESTVVEPSFIKQAFDVAKFLGPGLKLLFSPIAKGAIVKELCSCMNVSLETQDLNKAIEECPSDAPKFIQRSYDAVMDLRNDGSVQSIRLEKRIQFLEFGFPISSRTAVYNPPYGCTLVD